MGVNDWVTGYVRDRLRDAVGETPPPRNGNGSGNGDPLDQIRRLGELRDEGLITPEEFDAKKTEILGRM